MIRLWAALFWIAGQAAHAGCGHSGFADTNQTVTTGPEVFLLQQSLVALGYLDGPVDGSLGSGTRSALRDLQQDAGLAVSGRADPDTLSAIYDLGQRRGIAVRFAPDPAAAHQWPAFEATLQPDEGGRCYLTLQGAACPADQISVKFPSFVHPSVRGYKNTGCRFARDASGEPVFQHLGNEFVFLWIEQSGYAYPQSTTLVGVSQDCTAHFQPDHSAQEQTVVALDNMRFDTNAGFETKLFASQYDDILTQADRMDLANQVHPSDSYQLTRMHNWSDQAKCE